MSKRRASRREPIIELGFSRAERLDEETCRIRVRRLERGLRHDYWADDPELRDYAKYYLRWYRWCAKRMAEGVPIKRRA